MVIFEGVIELRQNLSATDRPASKIGCEAKATPGSDTVPAPNGMTWSSLNDPAQFLERGARRRFTTAVQSGAVKQSGWPGALPLRLVSVDLAAMLGSAEATPTRIGGLAQRAGIAPGLLPQAPSPLRPLPSSQSE